MIEQLFFELIRVAIGTQNTLSRPPSKGEWAELYTMAKKQSLVGICFAGLQKLYNSVNQEPRTKKPQPNSTQNQEPNSGYGLSVMDSGLKKSDQEPITPNQEPEITQNQEPRTKNLDEVLYLTWMGMAAKIQQRNEVVNRQCVELQKEFASNGIQSTILKGQGVALLYDEPLQKLRQSGDIDVWVDCEVDQCVRFAKKYEDTPAGNDQHVELAMFNDTEVEMHYTPCHLHGIVQNHRLRKWIEKSSKIQFDNLGALGFSSPNAEFNLVYLLIHMYRHVFGEGLGFRQLMDYYFTLKTADECSRKNAFKVICSLGLGRFTAGVMWVMQEVFCLKQELFLCEASEKAGMILLREVENGGNFGRFRDDDQFLESKNLLVRQIGFFAKNKRLFVLDPMEIVNLPLWSAYHWFRKRIKGY